MNRFKTLATMAIGVAVMIGAAMLCPAQTGPITQPPAPQPPMTQPPAPQPQPMPASSELTPETLKVMLTNLGYEFTEEKLEKTSIFRIKIEHYGIIYSVSVSLSNNHKKLWICTQLANVPPASEMPLARALKLMELNDKIGPSFFSYRPKYKAIWISHPSDNRGVTPVSLRAEIMALLDDCQETREHWDVEKWPEFKVATGPGR